MLRVLGYPRIVSMENFRRPNFKLVAELLAWIVRRFAPSAQLPETLETEQERVIFIKAAVLSMLQNASIKLNPIKLYQADGYAIKELITPIRTLYYTHTARGKIDNGESAVWKELRGGINAQLEEVQDCRQLSALIPLIGASIYDLLTKEIIAKKARSKALSFSVNFADVENSIKNAIVLKKEVLVEIKTKLQNISSDEAALDEKIMRKKSEYDQLQKRLVKLQAFRPQHLDEYEKLEKKVKELYEIYVVKFRNLSHLQSMLLESTEHDQQRSAKVEQNIRNLIERRRAEEMAKAKKTAEENVDEERHGRSNRVFGNITGAGIIDEDEDDEELENYAEPMTNGEYVSDDEATVAKESDEGNNIGTIKDDSIAETNEGDDEKLETSSNDDF